MDNQNIKIHSNFIDTLQTPNLSNALKDLKNSIFKGNFDDVMSNYIYLKSQEYSFILREVETPFENLNELRGRDTILIEPKLRTPSDQVVEIITTKNKLKRFKSNHDKILTDLILRKHSSSRSLNYSQIKKSDSLYSSDLYTCYENKTSYETAKDSPYSEMFSSVFMNSENDDDLNKINIYESLKNKNENMKINSDTNKYANPNEKIQFKMFASNGFLSQESEGLKEKEKIVEKDQTNFLFNFSLNTNNKNLLNSVINVKLKIFKPNIE